MTGNWWGCAAISPGFMLCTLNDGHDGPHEAHGPDDTHPEAYEVWATSRPRFDAQAARDAAAETAYPTSRGGHEGAR